MKHQTSSSFLSQIDASWTLFLDRDGVINQRIEGGYVSDVADFKFIAGVIEAVHTFRKIFGKIIVVTNQQGIGKGLMTEKQLKTVHLYMAKQLNNEIDKIYHAPYLEAEKNPCRKPGIGMALQAKKDFPEIDFQKSVMVGDAVSDILFGKNAGMKTIFIGKKSSSDTSADMYLDSLFDLKLLLKDNNQ